AVDAEKKKLPGVLWSGTFSRRANHALIAHSGLLCGDLDSLNGDFPAVRADLLTSPHLVALFKSPSGAGLKAIFRVPANAEKHLASFRAVERHVRERTGVQIDESGKDMARLCFLSYDPDLYHNPDATEIEPLPEPEQPKRVSNGAVDLNVRQRIATEFLGQIDWQSETSGFFTCPGKHLHTTGDGERDCKIDIDDVPSIHCFHDHCRGIIDALNRELRARIGKAEWRANNEAQKVAAQHTDNASNSAGEQTIARLAAMPVLEYERQRKEEAERLGCRESVLDKLVEARRSLQKNGNGKLQGSEVVLSNPEPWPEPANGAEVLDQIAARAGRYLALPLGAADIIALW